MSQQLYIETYAMCGDSIAMAPSEIQYFDVIVRPEGGDPVEEHENLSESRSATVVAQLEKKYPSAIVVDEIIGG